MLFWSKSYFGAKKSKNRFSDQAVYVTITDANIGSLTSVHILFDNYFDHMPVKLDQNRTVRNMKTQNAKVFGKKWLTIFETVLTPF